MKVRFHRGGLPESLKTMFVPKDWKDFCKHCEKNFEDIITDSISCSRYSGSDTRIGWEENWIITAKFKDDEYNYPIAFSNENIMKLKEQKSDKDSELDHINKLWKKCISEDKTKDVAWFVIKWCVEHKDLL